MFRFTTCLSLVGAVALTACSMLPENPAQYSQNRAPVYTQPVPTYAQPVNASYQTTQNSAAVSDCRRRETNRELIGGAVGGSAGAYAGKKLIGGTKGLVAGAALGGVVGYGIGDISADCSPPTSPSYSPAIQSHARYQSAPTYNATAANFAPVSCPVGTKPHSSGSCLLDNPNQSLDSETFTGIPARTIQRVQIPARSESIIRASAAPATPTAPSAHRSKEVTRQSNPESYGGSYTGNSAGNYRVVTGDTVYSLARQRCVSVSAIQTSNGLDATYGIKIGQSLNLPNSQC